MPPPWSYACVEYAASSIGPPSWPWNGAKPALWAGSTPTGHDVGFRNSESSTPTWKSQSRRSVGRRQGEKARSHMMAEETRPWDRLRLQTATRPIPNSSCPLLASSVERSFRKRCSKRPGPRISKHRAPGDSRRVALSSRGASLRCMKRARERGRLHTRPVSRSRASACWVRKSEKASVRELRKRNRYIASQARPLHRLGQADAGRVFR